MSDKRELNDGNMSEMLTSASQEISNKQKAVPELCTFLHGRKSEHFVSTKTTQH